MAFLAGLSLRLLGLAFLYFAIRKLFSYRRYSREMKRRDCSPLTFYRHKDPFFGSDLYRKTVKSKANGDYKDTLQGFYQQYGKTFQANVFGETVIYTSDMENIQAINTTQFDNFGVEGIRRQANANWVGEGVFVSDGATWKHARKLVMPIFARAHIADLSGFSKHLNRMLDLIPRNGETVDLRPLFRRLFLDSSTEFLFAESAETLLPHSSKLDAEKFLASFDRAMLGVDRRMILRAVPFLFGRVTQDKEWKEACAEVHSLVDGYIDRALSEHAGSQKNDVPQQLSDASSSPLPDRERPFSMLYELVKEIQEKQFIRDQLISLFFPARDANAIAISDLFFQLARNPHVWAKLRVEILRNDEPLTFESLKSMKYLQAVISESLRLLAPASLSQRTCTTDCVLPRGGGLGGQYPIFVQKGTQVECHFGVMQRDTDVWGPDAETFRPERWESSRPKWEYIPFLGGGRICPAQQMVLNQMGYVLARFAREFEMVENCDPVEEFVEEYMFSVQSRNGVKVRLVPAKKIQ